MKKIVDLVKKYNTLCIILLILFSIVGIALNVKIVASDELWCFQNIYKMYNGYQIYKDANVICTPLFFYLGEIIFKIFGANFLIFRVYHILILTIFFYFTYKVLKKLLFRDKVAIIILWFIIMYGFYGFVSFQANYNLLAMTFVIIGLYFLLDEDNQNKYKSASKQGIILFLVFITKQNIGIFYGLGLLIFSLFEKDKIKNKMKKLFFTFSIVSLLIGLSIIILSYYDIFYDFLNYVVLGLKEFSNENLFIDFQYTIILLFFMISNLVISVILVKNDKINEIEKQNLRKLNSLAFPLSLVIYPIGNQPHFLMSVYILFISFVYICNFIIREIGIKDKIFEYVSCFLVVISIIYSLVNFVGWTRTILASDYFYQYQDPYYGGIIEEDLKENIDIISKYISQREEKVIVLSSKAALYMVPLKQSNGYFDLPLKGNLGKDGEDGLITKLEEMDHVLIMMEQEEDLMWQESVKVREYIINNFNPINEIENFIVYKKEKS